MNDAAATQAEGISATHESTSTPPTRDPRRHDLDALRGFAMLLGIVLHASLSFYPEPLWAVRDNDPIGVVEPLAAAIHGFRMPLFFLLSGFFTAMLWKRRGMRGMVRQRGLRIGIPVGIGCLTIIPLMWWVTAWAAKPSEPDPAAAVEVSPEATVWTAARDGEIAVLRVLVENGADVNAADPGVQTTPLGWATVANHPETVEVLLELGADPNVVYAGGSTASHSAMFFGRAAVAELLVEADADLTKTDVWGSTPIETLNVPQGITMMIVGSMQMEMTWEDIEAGRAEIRTMLETAGEASAEELAAAGGVGFQDVLNGLMAFPFFSHLWFLWHLCWLVLLFGLAAVTVGRLPWRWLPTWLIATPIALVWLVPLTAWGQSLMQFADAGLGMGADLSAGVLPIPRVLGYYTVFYFFGVVVYLRRGTATRLGRGWWWMLPLSVVVLLPTMELAFGTDRALAWGLSEQTFGLLNVTGQALFCWLAIFGLIGMFEALLGRERGWVRYLSDSAYWLYLAHLPLIFVGQRLLRDVEAPGWAKFAVLMIVSTLILLVSYQWLVRYTPIGWLLNGRRTRGQLVAADRPSTEPV